MLQQLSNQGATSLNEAAVYQIRLEGKISSTQIQITDDMQLRQDVEQKTINLIGWLPDQSALLGLLNTLNDIR